MGYPKSNPTRSRAHERAEMRWEHEQGLHDDHPACPYCEAEGSNND